MSDEDYQDDPSIMDDDGLLRRVPIQPAQIIWDDNLKQQRPSSAAFKDHPNGSPMSIALQPVLSELNLPVQSVLSGYETTHALVMFTADVARKNGQGVARAPLPPSDPAHGVVFGPKTQKVRQSLAKAAVWVVPPPPRGTKLT